jgi:BirA family biotin operon repressor/biotin-[acetyl-CoA-carboxylase] ligase
MSLLFKPDIMPSQASMLTIVAAMAVAAAIKDLLPEADCKIKWPNDIVINERKVCGILTEMSAELEYIHYVVIGIGINVNTTEFPDEIKDIAASIYSLTGVKVNRSQLVVAFSKEFKKFYNIFMVKKDLGDLVNDYDKMLINKGREVSTTGAVAIEGKAVGINSLGELIIKTKDGALESVRAGEVSVRGLYSYV